MRTEWSTADLPKPSRFDAWREFISEAYAPLEPYRRDSTPFFGRICARRLGRCSLVELVADAHGVTRGHSEIMRSQGECYSISLVKKGEGVLVHNGKTVHLKSGDLRVTDYACPLDLWFDKPFELTSFMLPRDMLYPRLTAPSEAPATRISSAAGLGKLVRSYLAALAQLPEHQVSRYAGTLIDNLCNLVSLAVESERPTSPRRKPGLHEIRLASVKDYARQHLSNPSLSPASVAGACGISVRYLHKLFRLHGETFGRWLLKQRLEKCRVQISDPRFCDRSLSEISYSWGFNNLSHFDHAFRNAYGNSPREHRKQAQEEYLKRVDDAE